MTKKIITVCKIPILTNLLFFITLNFFGGLCQIETIKFLKKFLKVIFTFKIKLNFPYYYQYSSIKFKRGLENVLKIL